MRLHQSKVRLAGFDPPITTSIPRRLTKSQVGRGICWGYIGIMDRKVATTEIIEVL